MRSLKLPIWALLLAIAAVVALLGWWGNVCLRATIENQLRAQLTTTLNANVTALGIWSTNQTRLATSLSDYPTIHAAALKILQDYPDLGRDLRGQPQPELETFVRVVRPRLNPLGYEIADLVNTNFQVLANSIRAQSPGNFQVSDTHTNKFAQLFASGDPVIITPFKPDMLQQRRAARLNPHLNSSGANDFRRAYRGNPQIGRPRRGDVTLMQVAAPVRNDDGDVVGALALIVDTDHEFSRILTVARSGQSGETYAFDQTGLLISHSRFDEQLKSLGLLDASNTTSALNVRLHDPGGDLTAGYQLPDHDLSGYPLVTLVANALDAAMDGTVSVQTTPVRDYRGVPVVGASRWLPQFGFGVATQIDAAEAYRPLRVLQAVFAVLVLFLLLCATAIFVVSNLTWRRRLDEAELKLKQLGQYTLEEKIGAGGMGVVYRARHALLRRDTAVKLLLPHRADPAAVARFEREVCLTCRLTHPNTIQVYDYGHTPDGIFYYAMEYLHGLNLHDLVVNYGPQPESRVIHILKQICDSLAEAHSVGLIHRDIKPGNVFLCHRGGVYDFVKVLDFGLVREYTAPEESTEQGTQPSSDIIEGTPWFTPPEAIHSAAQADPRSDLYSLGALGYYLLTGFYIFEADNIREIYHKQLTEVPIPPTQRVSGISAEMEQILLRCLEKDVNRRPQSAAELRKLLLACAAATDWTLDARQAWWDAYDHRPEPAVSETTRTGNSGAITPQSSSMPTVRIDLANRE